MISRKITKIFFISVSMFTLAATSYAWTLTYDSTTGKWSGKCKDGQQWIVGDGANQPSNSHAAAICAKHGGRTFQDEKNPVTGVGENNPLTGDRIGSAQDRALLLKKEMNTKQLGEN